MIEVHDTAAGVIGDPETIEEVLALYRALSKLKFVITVNGVTHEFPVQFSDGNAVIVATINT